MKRPKRKTPPFPPWDRDECELCAAPVRRVWIGSDYVHTGMRPCPLGDRRGTIAANPMNNRLEGRYLAAGQRPEEFETLWILHRDVCPEVPRPQQLALPTDQEST